MEGVLGGVAEAGPNQLVAIILRQTKMGWRLSVLAISRMDALFEISLNTNQQVCRTENLT